MSNAEVEGFLNELVLDVSKSALKSPFLAQMHESDTEIYLFLYIYFQKAAIRQRREDAIAISKASVVAVLEQVLAKALLSTSAFNNQRKGTKAQAFSEPLSQRHAYEETEDAPIVQQRLLREQLASLKPHAPNLSAFAEVLEMCRLVDQEQKRHALPPFGSVNLLHFVALLITLMPTRRLFDLISLVWECHLLPEIARLRIFYIWSIIDRQNRDALRELCLVLEERPGMNVPMLLEFFPQVEHMNTAKYRSLVTATGTATTTIAPRSIVHTSDEEAVPNVVAPQPPATDEGGDDDDDDTDDGRTDEDRAFWSNLVS